MANEQEDPKKYFVGALGEGWFVNSVGWFYSLDSAIKSYLSRAGKIFDSVANENVDLFVAKEIDFKTEQVEENGVLSIRISPSEDIKGTQPYYTIRKRIGTRDTYGGEISQEMYDIYAFKTLTELIKDGEMPRKTKDWRITKGLEIKLE
ncbi:hypothetical protein GOV06_05865 [Candidatus Woesearchaeota archaeon]|nr:hypothetical protein [Candidatus Woesearchaeota archaeon]